MRTKDLNLTKFISEHIEASTNEIANKLSLLKTEQRSFIIQQISGRQKIQKKLPTFYQNLNLIIPPSINLEQSSSEDTARFKASFFLRKNILDITGGLGIDAFAFSERNKVTYCEINEELATIVSTNAKFLKLSTFNVLATDGVSYVKNNSTCYDLIYLDPARRDRHNKKLIRFEDCTPNILAIKEDLFKKSTSIMVKTSPMFDINLGLQELQNVCKIWVVAVKNEVKEILWLLDKNVSLTFEDVPIIAVNLKNETTEKFEATLKEEKQAKACINTVGKFLYEPNASLLKAGFFNLISTQLGIKKLAKNSHLYTSDELIRNFPGRIFEVKEVLPFKTKLLKKRLQKKKINISARNFPSLVRDLISKFQLVDGGEEFVFFTQQNENEKIVIITKKTTT